MTATAVFFYFGGGRIHLRKRATEWHLCCPCGRIRGFTREPLRATGVSSALPVAFLAACDLLLHQDSGQRTGTESEFSPGETNKHRRDQESNKKTEAVFEPADNRAPFSLFFFAPSSSSTTTAPPFHPLSSLPPPRSRFSSHISPPATLFVAPQSRGLCRRFPRSICGIRHGSLGPSQRRGCHLPHGGAGGDGGGLGGAKEASAKKRGA